MTNLTTKLLGGVALSAMLALPAMAADLPARAPARAAPVAVPLEYNWTGFYIGGHAGYAFGDSTVTLVGPPAVTGTVDLDGFVGGGHVGINWQINRLVLGIEGAVSIGGQDGTVACVSTGAGITSCNGDIDHFWRAGGRVGFAAGPTGNWLFYGMGGFARANFETWGAAGGAQLGAHKTHHHGWYGGGGIEYAISPNFIIGVEAYHVSLDTERHSPGTIFARDVDLDFTVVQARASYKFGWGGPVVARY